MIVHYEDKESSRSGYHGSERKQLGNRRSLLELVDQNILKLSRHMKRMDKGRLAKTIYRMESGGAREEGRPIGKRTGG